MAASKRFKMPKLTRRLKVILIGAACIMAFLWGYLFAPRNPVRYVVANTPLIFGMTIYSFLIFVFSALIGTGLLVVFWVKAGYEGRFILRQNLAGKGGIFLGLYNTGHVTLHAVKSMGRMLRSGKKMFLSLPELLELKKDPLAEPEAQATGEGGEAAQATDNGNRDLAHTPQDLREMKKFNSVLRDKALFCGKPFTLGAIMSSVASPPDINLALKMAEDDKYEDIRPILDKLADVFKDGIKDVYFYYEFEVNKLAEYLNLSWSEHDADEIFTEGYLTGIKTQIRNNQIMVVLLILMLFGWVLTIFWLGRN